MTMQFTNNAQFIDCGSDASLDDIAQKTIVAWIFPDSFGGSGQGTVCEKSGQESSIDGWAFDLRSAAGPQPRENLKFRQFWSGSRGEWRSPSGSIAPGTVWYHVAVTYDRGDLANDPVIYIDGVSVTVTETNAPTGTILSDAAELCHIANRSDTNFGFDGRISDLRIYNRILSADEIATIYAARGVDGIVDGLVMRHMMDEDALGVVASGTDLHKDLSNSGNDGTPSASPTFDEGVIRSRRRMA